MKFAQEKDCSCVGEITLYPWGDDAGNEWSFKAKHGGIKQIIIRSGWVIDSVVFKGDDGDGDYSPKFGGEGGDRTSKIDIDFPSEFLTGISGTYGSISMFVNNICSISFHTNTTKYGPFGSSGSGTSFSAHANHGMITGFHGRCSNFIKAIGIYIMPVSPISTEVGSKQHSSEICSRIVPRFLSPPRSAAAIGGNGGREWDDWVFATVKGVHVRLRVDTGVVSAVRFSYMKKDGSDILSPFHGGYCGGDMHRKTILFAEKGEYLIGVEGFYGAAEGMSDLNVIKSLCFITNKAKYGPIGAEIGMFFTSMNSVSYCDRKVVGFHGRSGAYLDAIGLHTEYF